MTVAAKHDFISFARRGGAAELTEVDPLTGPIPFRGGLKVQLDVRADDDVQKAETAVQLHGPGDVVGIDPRHVIRTDPADLTPNFEPNYFPAIEFDHPDFPWLFTPVAAAPSPGPKDPRRLRPWLSLIVLADDEFSVPERRPEPLPAIQVKSGATLPSLAEAWAWAHAQVSGGLGGDDLGVIAANDPGRVLSRLVCPRRLAARTHYTAFLVPAFDLGVKAGLGEPVPSAPGTTAKPAWDSQSANLMLPVYHRFEFTTSERGDFESLVRELKPRPLPKEVGGRPMAVDQPGWGVRTAGGPLLLGGALRSLGTQDTPWSGSARDNFQADIAKSVNLAAAPLDAPTQDPVVVPPLYGRWHAARSTIDPSKPGWPNELNADPRFRAMAGLGTRVVLDQRSQLMLSAWQQVDGIEEANRILREAQLARAASTEIAEKHLVAADDETTLTMTAPVQQRVLASPVTVAAAVARSRLPSTTLSAAFRRVARPLGPLRRRQGAGPAAAAVVTRLNAGDISANPPPRGPGGLVSLENRSNSLFPSWAPDWLRPLLRYGFWALGGLALLVLLIALLLGLLVGPLAPILAAGVAIALLLLAGALVAKTHGPDWRAGGLLRLDGIRPESYRDSPPRPDFHVQLPGRPQPPDAPASTDSPDAAAFRDAAAALAEILDHAGFEVPRLEPLDVPTLTGVLVAGLDPASTVPARVAGRVAVDAKLAWEPDDPLEEIMAAPQFPQPMYEPLRDLSQELLLPGLASVEPNTIGLLRENHAFVESYMVGLNHGMARQLLWNRYPTDQRGSYFRQFWDVRSYVRKPDDPADDSDLREQLEDIPPIHRWKRLLPLGSHPNRPEIAPEKVTLLVRGDLLRRYPSCVIYACEAKRESGKLVLGQAERYPLFRGTLSPDVTFFGFDLTASEARGEPGWFFVFQEQPSEPRFGLDEPGESYAVPQVKDWNQLSWANFAATADDLQKLGFAPVSKQPSSLAIAANTPDAGNQWASDSAQMAFITLRRPARIAIHAQTMVPSG